MKAHKKTIMVCFFSNMVLLLLIIILRILNVENNIFYNITLALFTGLIVSLITTISMYLYERNIYIHDTYSKLLLIYKQLISTQIEFSKLGNELISKQLFTNSMTLNRIDVFTQQIMKEQQKISYNSYVNLIRKNGKSNFDNFFCYLKWFLNDLWGIRYICQTLEEKVLQYQTLQTNKKLEQTSKNNNIDIYSIDLKLNNLNLEISSVIGEGKRYSIQLALDIERTIIMIHKLYRFKGNWEDEKEFIIEQVQLINN